jgi:hypothetical protein
VSCSLGGEEEAASAWAYWGHSTQVPPGVHSTFRPTMWPSFITVVEPPSTSAGGPMSSSLRAAGYSTSSSTVSWGRVSVLQLWLDWALLS